MKVNIDALILGGGIAGLWLARKLQLDGYRVILLENQKLGSGQTLASQGIIHGGLKYALMGQVNDTAKRIATVSREWLTAIEGNGDINLHGVKISSVAQYMLVPGGLFGSLAGAMGHAVFGDTIQKLDKREWPGVMEELGFSGQIIAMKEPGIDVQSAVKILSDQLAGACCYYSPDVFSLHEGKDGNIYAQVGEIEFHARKIISTAAVGNDWLAEKLGIKPASQRRPLKMVFIKGDFPMAFWHGVTASPKPAFTISTHYTKNGESVWYIGGGVAEEGVAQNDEKLFSETEKVLKKYLPKVNLEDAEWASYAVDRVEGLDPQGRLPERPSYQQHKNVTLAWVNKLTFAPLLASEIISQMGDEKLGGDMPEIPMRRADVSETPWDQVIWKKR